MGARADWITFTVIEQTAETTLERPIAVPSFVAWSARDGEYVIVRAALS